MKLIDVNVLIYAIDTGSEHHERSRDFVEAAFASDELIALPWPVISGVIRTLTLRAMKLKLSSSEVLALVEGWLKLPNVVTLEPGPQLWPIFREMLQAGPAFGNLTYDAHLAALAVANGAELCSADSDFARFPRLKWTDPTRSQA